MNFLASPPLVVAYALAGNMKLDLYKEPLGIGKDGKPVYLRDVWPSTKEIHDLIAKHVTSTQFKQSYASVFEGDANWHGRRDARRRDVHVGRRARPTSRIRRTSKA